MKKAMIFSFLITTCNMSFGQNRIYDSLRYQLQIIDQNDQSPRIQSDSIRKQYAGDTFMLKKQLNSNWKITRYNDSVDLIKVSSMIDKYGWLGPDEIGDDGSSTLFIVIQHADLKTQEKYLPIMRVAVNTGKAKASRLALLEDRVALREGKKQIYGSQFYLMIKTNEAYVLPMEDPTHVDLRRSAVGLHSMAEYLWDGFQVKWDISQYFKDLPLAYSILRANPF
jgi:hypothetical protein